MAKEALQKSDPFIFWCAEVSEFTLGLVVGGGPRYFGDFIRSEVGDPAHKIDVVPDASTAAIFT